MHFSLENNLDARSFHRFATIERFGLSDKILAYCNQRDLLMRQRFSRKPSRAPIDRSEVIGDQLGFGFPHLTI